MKPRREETEREELELETTGLDRGKKRKSGEEDRQTTGAEVEKILKMVILLGSAQQAKAQDQEEDEDWSSLVQLVVLTVFAMIGLSAVIRWLVMLVPEGRSLEKKEDEEKLEKRVKEALSAASGQRGASRAQESDHGKATLAQKRQGVDEEESRKREHWQLQPQQQKAVSPALSSFSSLHTAPPPIPKHAPLPTQASSSTSTPKMVGAPQLKSRSEGQSTDVVS